MKQGRRCRRKRRRYKEKDEEGSNEYDPNAARRLKGPAISVKKFPGQN
jgi:hypothetical protein